MCSCEWPGRLKCLATGLDRSDIYLMSKTKERKRQTDKKTDRQTEKGQKVDDVHDNVLFH